MVHPITTQGLHGRQMGEAVGAQALHPAPFMVDANQQVGADGLDVGVELGHLLAVGPVAAEVDHPPHQRMHQAPTVSCAQRQTGHIKNDRGMGHHDNSLFSTSTKLAA
jgi:hypothetical protein